MARRSDGEGAIYETSDGRWRGAVVIGWEAAPGTARGVRPIRKYVSGTSKRAVAEKIRKLRGDGEAGLPLTAKPPKVHAWLDYWLEEVARPSVRPNTYTGYAVCVARFKKLLPAGLALDALMVEHLERVYSQMRAEGHSAGNVALHHRTMHRALQVALKRRRVRVNVADLVELPEVEPFKGRPMTAGQARAFLRAADRDRARWLFALLMGWRQGECLGLSWDRVDLDVGTVERGQQLQRIRGEGLAITPIKRRAGERTLPLPPLLVEVLRALKARQDEARRSVSWKGAVLPVFGKTQTVDLVFCRPDGRPVPREDDWARWHEILREARIPTMRPHDARHSMATLLAELGVHPKVVQELLGHSSEAVAMQVYTHVPSESARAALVLLEGHLADDSGAGAAGSSGSTSGSTTGGAPRRRTERHYGEEGPPEHKTG